MRRKTYLCSRILTSPSFMRKRTSLLLLLVCILIASPIHAQTYPKREFRGTWIHTVGQDRYAAMNQDSMKRYFISLLDNLRQMGINAIIFQVRPEADAWFESSLEPWSRYITGTQGKNPGWDPFKFLIEEGHKRAMEVHAWINPYRVRTSPTKALVPDHLFYKKRDLFVEYGDYIWFDPGMPASREHILTVVKDLVERYDIDAVHMDDYFYPYPIEGKTFGDSRSFKQYGIPKGFSETTKADWRRENVNTLIKELHATIHTTKPWVKFGISPFGIYRNDATGVNGSKTKGFTNYDGLYADILLWVKNGWVDYIMPQLYWEIGHKSADYQILVDWWAKNSGNVPLYIGQDVVRTMKAENTKQSQMWKKMHLAAQEKTVSGHCFWPAYELVGTTVKMADSLTLKYFKYPALHPADNAYDQTPPNPVRYLSAASTANGKVLTWAEPEAASMGDKVAYYVVYGFKEGETINLDKASNIVNIVTERTIRLAPDTKTAVCIVTAVDRFHNESDSVSVNVP